MAQNRQSQFSTVFLVALILSFTSQSILLAPNINTGTFRSIPAVWLPAVGWTLFLLSAFLLSLSIFDYPTRLQQGLILAGAIVLCTLGFFYFQQSAFVNSLISLVIALGMIIAALGLPFFGYAQHKDMLPILTLMLNGLCGIGLIIHSLNTSNSSSTAPLDVFELSIGLLLLSTIVLKFVFHKNEN